MKTILKTLVVFLLLVLSSGMVIAQTPAPCPQGQVCTAFIWVNGIWVPDSAGWATSVQAIGAQFITSQNLNPNNVKFDAVYNQSDSKFRDLVQAGYQLSVPINTYYADWTKLNTNIADHTSLMAAAINLFSQSVSLQSLDSDMVAIDTAIKKWWDAGYRVVLVGHSQGNWFVDKAYEIRALDADGSTQARNIQLPNSNKLSVVSIATPVSYVADGRKKWTSHCNDFINGVPYSLGSDSLASIPCTFSGIPIFNGSIGQSFLDFATSLINLGVHATDHLLSYYFTDGNPAEAHTYQHLVDSLPDPNCAVDNNCYLKDVYTSTTDFRTNWVQTNLSGYFTTWNRRYTRSEEAQ